MSHENDEQRAIGPGPEHDDPLAELLRLAGPRPPIPQREIDPVRSAAHARWRRKLGVRRRRRILAVALPLAASLLLALTATLWRERNPTPPPTLVATAITVAPDMEPGLLRHGDVERTLTIGDEIRIGDELTVGNSPVALRLAGLPTLAANGSPPVSSVRLDRASRVRFVGTRQVALMQGRLYVDSGLPAGAGDATAGLVVDTPLGTVRDIGTQFEVALEEDALRVRVREGRIMLERDGQQHEADAGTELTAGAADAEVQRSTYPSHGAGWRWVLAATPPFELEGTTLQTFLDWLGRETGWTIRFDDPALEAELAPTVLHGSLEGLAPDEAPEVVLASTGLEHRLDDGVLVLSAAAD